MKGRTRCVMYNTDVDMIFTFKGVGSLIIIYQDTYDDEISHCNTVGYVEDNLENIREIYVDMGDILVVPLIIDTRGMIWSNCKLLWNEAMYFDEVFNDTK